MRIWIVGRAHPPYASALRPEPSPWEFLGAYSSESAADERCTQEHDFIAWADVDVHVSDEIVFWPGIRYPRSEAA